MSFKTGRSQRTYKDIKAEMSQTYCQYIEAQIGLAVKLTAAYNP